MDDAIKEHGVDPDVVENVSGVHEMEITYGDLKVDKGNILTPTQVREPPSHMSWPVEDGAFYTLLMTDPDNLSRKDPKFREWHHWLVVNIPGCKISEGEHVAEYVGSGPIKDTGLHRYIFLAFKQPGKVTYPDPIRTNRSADGRGGCKTKDLVCKLKLCPLVACNFYQAEYDDSVPKLYEKLSGK